MDFRSPSKIQRDVLSHLLSNPSENIIAQSRSGTGKNAAFSMAILSRIEPEYQSSQALILVPTYELAIQTGSLIEKMARFLPYIKIAYAVSGSGITENANLIAGQRLTQPIVIGTPGTICHWCYDLKVIDLERLRICCIDEADLMVTENSFNWIPNRLLPELQNCNCQIMLFSTTYSDEVIGFANQRINQLFELRLERENRALHNIRQFYMYCSDPQKRYEVIEKIYCSITIGQTIIFCRTIREVHDLARLMASQHHSARELTSALCIEQRRTVMEEFRKGVFRVLISANVATRGIDIPDVTLVINYDMPETSNGQPDYDTYLHRIGRCGRFGRSGFVFNLIDSLYDRVILNSFKTHFMCPIDEITTDEISGLELIT